MSAQHRRPGAAPGNEPGRDPEAARRRAEAAVAVERRIADRFARLHAATAALSAALTPTEVASAIAARGATLPGACGCAFAALAPGGALEVTAARGAVEQVTGGLLEIPLWAEVPLAEARRSRIAMFTGGEPAALGADLLAPAAGDGTDALHATAALPLLAAGELLGVVGVVFTGAAVFDEEERAFLQAFAHACAHALERARLYEAERQARLEAQRAEEAARRAVELQEQLVGIVGHDLRTPLAAIRMSTAVLFRRGDLSPEQARTLARVGASAARMTRIIHDLLDFTRVRKEGAIPVALRPADLVDLVRHAVVELSAVHPEVELRLDAPDAVAVEADPDRLIQAVTNLVGNAIQHGPPGAPVRVSIAADAGGVALAVHNEGPEIPPHLLGEIFEPFRRGREGGGLGLGLFIVREVVRAHGGAVGVRSGAGEGTTFTVRLPPGASPVTAPEPASTGRAAPDR